MSHLEKIIIEYYDWMGYLVKNNIKVGKLNHGGWEMELDVVAYHTITEHLIHLEPSLDAHSWLKREERFQKKFSSARKHIFSEVFTWLDPNMEVEQVAILNTHPNGRDTLAGGKLISIDELMADIRQKVKSQGIVAKNAIPEQYPSLRTLQLALNGYYRIIDSDQT